MGLERMVPLGQPYVKAPDEDRVPGIYECSGRPIPAKMPQRTNLKNELDVAIGHGAGDWIKVLASPIAKLVGKEGCSPCEAKRLVVNSYAKLKAKYGMMEALSTMKTLWDMSAAGHPEEALLKLKAKLDD